MDSQSHAVADRVDAVSQHGRDLLAQLSSLDPTRIADGLAAGDEAGSDLGIAAQTLSDLRYAGPAGLDERRLSQANQARLGAIDDLIGAAVPMPGTWHTMSGGGRELSRLLVALLSHDGLVFRATNAGRESDWPAALGLAREAADALADGRSVRDALSLTSEVSTLDDLLGRYSAYDTALEDMYRALRRGADPSSAQVQALRDRVEETASALPADDSDLKSVIEQATGAWIADGVATLEGARGKADQAVALLP